jgi:hypothetical protein
MNLKTKILILTYVFLYAFINYTGYIYKFEFVDKHLTFVKDCSEFTNTFDKMLMSFPNIESSDWNIFLLELNLHIFAICLILQYKLSIILNGRNGIYVLIFSLVFIFLLRHLSKQLSLSDSNLLRWFGLNTFTRSLKVYNFLLYFPSMPFLIFIINKSIADKLRINNK